jgi:hypothetical protein
VAYSQSKGVNLEQVRNSVLGLDFFSVYGFGSGLGFQFMFGLILVSILAWFRFVS